MLTYTAAARRPAGGRPALPGQADRRVRVGARPARRRRRSGMHSQRQVWKEPMGVVGAIVPWNFPFEVTINKLGQILATGNTIVLKPAPDTPWNATRLGRLVAEQTDIPAGVVNVVTSSDHLVGEELTLVAAGRHDLVHRLDRHRQADHGEGRGHAEARVPRARRQVGDDRARRRRLRRRWCPAASMVCMHAGQGCAMQTRMLLPAVALRRGRRADRRRP